MAFTFIFHYYYYLLLFIILLMNDCSSKVISEIRAKRNATTESVSDAPSPANCKTECQTESDGRTQKCTMKCQISMPFQMISHQQQQHIQMPTAQIVTKMSETRAFEQLEDCVKYCQEKSIATSVEQCRLKCEPVPSGGVTTLPQSASIPQLTLKVPLVTKTTETHEFVGQLEDCLKYCQENGIGKSAAECRGKCQPIGTTVVTRLVHQQQG